MSRYKRVLLKISGEALMGSREFGIEEDASLNVAKKIADLSRKGHEVAIVIGGGNLFRGIQQGPTLGIRRVPADQMGMLSTLINGIALHEALLKVGCEASILSAIDCPSIVEKYQWDKALSYLSNGRVVIFVGGTGHPFFTTDTTAALRASEIGASIFLKGTTRVDGIYTKDPRKFPDAKKYTNITYREVLDQKLGIIDLTAITLCMTNKIPIRVFNFFEGSLLQAVADAPFGSLVTGE